VVPAVQRSGEIDVLAVMKYVRFLPQKKLDRVVRPVAVIFDEERRHDGG